MPHLGVNTALVLAALSVIVLIYFIHHVPQSINVSNVIDRVGDDLVRSLKHLYPEQIGRAKPRRGPALPRDFESAAKIVRVNGAGGYLRLIDEDTLLDAATRGEVIVKILKRPGEFAVPGEPLLRIWPRESASDELAGTLLASFSWGSERTPNQDVLLPVQQLLEIVGHALSPGVNNQFTALLSIDQLGRGLAEMLGREVPDARRLDGNGALRIIADPVDHAGFVAAVSGPLRQYVHGDWIATTHVIDLLERLQALPDLEGSRQLLRTRVEEFRSGLPAPGFDDREPVMPRARQH